MVTTSGNIHFGAAKLIRDKTKNTIMTSIRQVALTYHARGIWTWYISGNSVFECIRDGLS